MFVASGWGTSTLGRPLPVFVMRLQGSAVASVRRYDLDVMRSVYSHGASDAVPLSDGRILLAIDPWAFSGSSVL